MGHQAFSWDKKLSDEDLLGSSSRCRSEPRGSAEQPSLAVPPSLPSLSPRRDTAPATHPIITDGVLATLPRQSILEWVERTKAAASAPPY